MDIRYLELTQFDESKVSFIVKDTNKKKEFIKINILYEYPDKVKKLLYLKTDFMPLCYGLKPILRITDNSILRDVLLKIDNKLMKYLEETKYCIERYNLFKDKSSNSVVMRFKKTKGGLYTSKIYNYLSYAKRTQSGNKNKTFNELTNFNDKQFVDFMQTNLNIKNKSQQRNYDVRYIFNPYVSMYTIGDQKKHYVTSLMTIKDMEIKHNKSAVKSVIDENEVNMSPNITTHIDL